MATFFPCPNPECSYQFDMGMLPAKAMVTCPMCRTKFPYYADNPPAQRKVAEAFTPPVAEAAEAEADTEELSKSRPSREPRESRVVRSRPAPKRSILPTILGLAAFAGVIIAVLVVVYQSSKKNPFSRGKADPFSDERFNFRFDRPDSWANDMETRSKLNVNCFVLKRENPDAWIALVAEDFKERSPRPSEIRERMNDRLRSFFRVADDSQREEIKDAKLGKQPAMGFEFQGTVDENPVRGVCLGTSYKGIAYVWFAWSADKVWDEVRKESEGMRERFTFWDKRNSWKEGKTNRIIFTLPNEPYQVEDVDGVWKLGKELEEGMTAKKDDYLVKADEIDPAATMAFIIRYRPKVEDRKRFQDIEAKALVYSMDAADGDPVDIAKAHVLARLKKEVEGVEGVELSFENLEKSPNGIELPTTGPVMARFVMRNSVDRDRRILHILGAKRIGNKLVFVDTECQERHAQVLEEWLVNFASSLKEK